MRVLHLVRVGHRAKNAVDLPSNDLVLFDPRILHVVLLVRLELPRHSTSHHRLLLHDWEPNQCTVLERVCAPVSARLVDHF